MKGKTILFSRISIFALALFLCLLLVACGHNTGNNGEAVKPEETAENEGGNQSDVKTKYTVEHKYSDILLDTVIINDAVAGTLTNALAKDFVGFIAPESIGQKTIAEDGSTVVTIDYVRNMLVESFDHLPSTTEGNYEVRDSAPGNIRTDKPKSLYMYGVSAGYYFTHNGADITVQYNEERGGNVICFHKNSAGKVAQIYLTLTAQQKTALGEGAKLSFAYWSDGGTVKVNGYSIDDSIAELGSGWYKVTLTEDMKKVSFNTGTIQITYDNAGEKQILVDDIVVAMAQGYTVNHVYGSLDLKSQFIEAPVGSATNAQAEDFIGLLPPATVEQKTVAENGSTSITIRYSRDMLVDTLEHMPLPEEGNYSIKETGYQNSGKILMLDEKYTGYQVNYRAAAIEITNEAHSGDKAIRFQKDAIDKHITVEIALSAEQIETIQNGGNLSFWYKNNGSTSVKVNDVDVGGSGKWKQVVMTEEMLASSVSSGKIILYLYGNFNAASIWVDDIVVTPKS